VTKLECAWIPYREYAKKSGLDLKTVQKKAKELKLGPVRKHPKTGMEMLIWPPDMQSRAISELPEPGKGVWKTRIVATAEAPLRLDPTDIVAFKRIQNSYLLFAHSLGKPDEAATRARDMLNRSCFLLQWTIFEVFLRSTIYELIKRYPVKIACGNRGKKFFLSYEEILAMTNELTSIESLRDKLIQREIERMQIGGESVHGVINFLKSEFRFKSDPYKAWYYLKGKMYKAHFNDLMELKEVRNALVHDGGTPPETFFQKYPSVPRHDDAVLINDEYYLKAKLIVASIAYSIAKSIDAGKYYQTN
jgi:hypothetical protein